MTNNPPCACKMGASGLLMQTETIATCHAVTLRGVLPSPAGDLGRGRRRVQR